jgi:hypothetical protein
LVRTGKHCSFLKRKAPHGGGAERSHDWLANLQVLGRFLATIRDHLVFNCRAIVEAAQSRAFARTDMHEHVLAAALRLNESIAFGALNHFTVPVAT